MRVELFCTDGYYSNYALQRGASELYGLNIDERYIKQARLVTKVLGYSDKIKFSFGDVFTITQPYDFCIRAEGLYHISNPDDLMRLLKSRVRHVLVIQTVYFLTQTCDDYFETPAPGWRWGFRFSYPYLLEIVKTTGWRIFETSINQLDGNTRLEDRGSAFLFASRIKEKRV